MKSNIALNNQNIFGLNINIFDRLILRCSDATCPKQVTTENRDKYFYFQEKSNFIFLILFKIGLMLIMFFTFYKLNLIHEKTLKIAANS